MMSLAHGKRSVSHRKCLGGQVPMEDCSFFLWRPLRWAPGWACYSRAWCDCFRMGGLWWNSPHIILARCVFLFLVAVKIKNFPRRPYCQREPFKGPLKIAAFSKSHWIYMLAIYFPLFSIHLSLCFLKIHQNLCLLWQCFAWNSVPLGGSGWKEPLTPGQVGFCRSGAGSICHWEGQRSGEGTCSVADRSGLTRADSSSQE